MKYLLVIMFFVNGPEELPVFADGLLPLGFEDATSCEKGRQTIKEQIELQSDIPFFTACYEKQEVGTPA